MSPQSIVCATCDATVPYGRLSCPACGELLASVAGAARPTRTRAATARATKARATERAAPAVLLDVPPLTEEGRLTDEVPATTVAGAQPPSAPLAASDREPSILQPVSGAPAADAPFEPAPPADADTHGANGVAAAAAARNLSPVAWPADQAMPPAPPVEWPADQAKPDPSPEGARPVAPYRSIPDAPGAYVPPILFAEPAGPPAPARAWAGQPAADGAASATSEAATSQSSWAGELLDAGRVTEFVGWLAVAGSAMAAVGFLLPWGVSVIGASGIGYFDRWGLAGPFHPLVLLSLLAVLGLSLVPNRIPLWLRVGVPGLGLGALLLGLAWPYLVGLSGTGPGAMVVSLGALVLGTAGIVALATDRHAHEDRAV